METLNGAKVSQQEKGKYKEVFHNEQEKYEVDVINKQVFIQKQLKKKTLKNGNERDEAKIKVYNALNYHNYVNRARAYKY